VKIYAATVEALKRKGQTDRVKLFVFITLWKFFNSHLFWLNSHPFFHPNRGRAQVWGLWSIRAQLENLPAEVIELIKGTYS
jgi:hypothetical protein